MLLGELTWVEVEEYLARDDRLLLPVGSTEQHGRHLPLGTDASIAYAIAKEVGEATGVLVAPLLPYGMSLHHMAFPGTISLKPSTLEALILEVLQSLHQHGFRRILIVNGHGGNTPSLRSGVATLLSQGPAPALKIRSWWLEPEVKEMLDQLLPPGAYASPGETSPSLVLHPKKVKLERARGRQDLPIPATGEAGLPQRKCGRRPRPGAPGDRGEGVGESGGSLHPGDRGLGTLSLI